ncbi:hypothetical protein ACTD5D_16885 [Nocardia takedensis]|uniref:hypothetical protein n=1 Tax=Nocardia takedensis TaxID=259390 RepID=UPI0002D7CFB8|nr:hypothetical protein [Nocardia takedensis]
MGEFIAIHTFPGGDEVARDQVRARDKRLTVRFPASLPARMIHQHRWHLAVEFGNWIIAAAPAAATL